MNLWVLGVDPGLTTGAVIIEWDGKTPRPESALIISHEIAFAEAPEVLNDLISRVHLIALEQFFISPRTLKNTRQMEPLDVIGGVKFLATLAATPLRMQTASVVKEAYTNADLKRLGYKVTGDHARDALRHALFTTHRPLGCTTQ